MNLALEALLDRNGIDYERTSKAQKVKLLARWVREFSDLVAVARHGRRAGAANRDRDAATRYARLSAGDFYLLPDDQSAMPSYSCRSAVPPDLSELVSDTFTKCDEIVVVDAGFSWSAVFVNHGSPDTVGWHFRERDEE